MKYADVTFTAPGVFPAGMPSAFPLKGFRVVPILGAAATIADIIAAYAGLIVRVSRGSQARSISGVVPVTITDDVAVPGPDWVRSPGFNALTLQAGQVGVVYRVWWAEDCYEVMDPGTSPMLNGFAGAASAAPLGASVVIGPAGAGTQALGSLANIPSLSTDGVAIPVGARGANAVVSAAATFTITGATLVWWRWIASLSRWAESAIQEAPATGRRDVYGAEQLVTVAGLGDRLFCEARSVTVSGGASVVVTLEVA